jgi:hypothetical protein
MVCHGFNPLPAIKPGDTLCPAMAPGPSRFQSTPGN